MKKKNIIIIISLIIAFAVLITVFTGCSLGHFTINFRHKVPFGMSINKKQKSQEEFNLKNKHMFKQNTENVPFVGIEMSQATKDVKGVLVNNIIVGSPAEKAGIKPKDIITVFDGKAVNNPYGLYSQVLSHKVGDNIKLTVSRNGQSLELNLTLAGLPNSPKTS